MSRTNNNEIFGSGNSGRANKIVENLSKFKNSEILKNYQKLKIYKSQTFETTYFPKF